MRNVFLCPNNIWCISYTDIYIYGWYVPVAILAQARLLKSYVPVAILAQARLLKSCAVGMAAPPRAGGRQQRRGRQQLVAVAPPELFDCPHARSLVDRWADGRISACEVQRLAKTAFDSQVEALRRAGVSEEFAARSLRHLARLGNGGRNGGHVAGELRSWLGEPNTPPPSNL